MSITHINETSGPDRTYQQVKLTLWHSGCWTLQTTDAHPGTHIIEKSLYPTADLIKGDFILVSRGDALSDDLTSMKAEYDVEVDAIERVDPQDNLFFADVVNEVSESLSPRQQEVLFTARDAGYYNWLREVPANEIAETVGVSGPTLLEHLRQGEQKIINTFLDEVQVRQKRL